MTTAPERIWAIVTGESTGVDAHGAGTTHPIGGWIAFPSGGLGTEYVRADLIGAMIAAAVQAERLDCAVTARLAMLANPQADELSCSICAAAIRARGDK